ncbi:phage holin family protein [Segeticoccus rhizosphaerae]|uniref:phage holin family protein n=1 Tax=Segeticoccus rhizosphaerae TaxID=1104777 RepID=UPI001EE478F4|nr:phage holin family protein [Ornithinicoccus soli]
MRADPSGATPVDRPARDLATDASSGEASTGELVARLTQQSSRLIRDELQLAKVEMAAKAKHAGVGAGLFGGAGILALFGFGALITTAILALALLLPAWLSALIVTVVLFAIAGIVALVGKKQTSLATPAVPEKTIDSIKHDVETVKEAGTS